METENSSCFMCVPVSMCLHVLKPDLKLAVVQMLKCLVFYCIAIKLVISLCWVLSSEKKIQGDN